MSCKRSKESQLLICNDYSNEKISIEELLEKYNLCPASLYRILKKNNIEKRLFHSPSGNKLSVNENYFENIDSENKAYWLGFITTKGHIYYVSENFARLTLSLPINDVSHLEKFKENLSAENKISILKEKEICKISINNINLCRNLEKHGVNLSKVNENLMSHYIRGLIDGNGYFYISKITNQINFRFSFPSPDFISEFRDYLIINCNLNYNKQICFKNNKYHVLFNGDNQVKNIFDYIYGDCSIKLESKYKYCKNYFDLLKSK